MVVGTTGGVFLFGSYEDDRVVVVGGAPIDEPLGSGGFLTANVAVYALIADSCRAINVVT